MFSQGRIRLPGGLGLTAAPRGDTGLAATLEGEAPAQGAALP